MNGITILAHDEAAETVNISRTDLDALIAAAEDAEDVQAIRNHQARIAEIGAEAHSPEYLTGEEMRRILDGESAVRIWREQRGMTHVTLAAAAGVAQSFVAMLENGQRTPSLGV